MLIYRDERMEFLPSVYGVRSGFSYGSPAWILPPVPWYPIVHPTIGDVYYPASPQSYESSRSSVSPENRSYELYRTSKADYYHSQEEKKSYDGSPREEYQTTDTAMSTDEKIYLGKQEKHNFFECHWKGCTCVFTTMNSLSNHLSINHADTKGGLFYCGWEGCSRSHRGFNARYKMLVHVRTHTNEKPHICNQCDKTFSRAENLKIHKRSHSGEKPYVCLVEGCNKAYSNSSDRFKHTKTHSDDKPYFCKIPGCLKRYTDPSSLRKHVKTYKHVEIINTPIEIHERMVDDKYEYIGNTMTPPPSESLNIERNSHEIGYCENKAMDSSDVEYVKNEEPLNLIRYNNSDDDDDLPSDTPLDLRIQKNYL